MVFLLKGMIPMNQQKKVIQSYRDLEVYQRSYRLAVEIDAMTKQLPKHEFWEEGQQIRKSSNRPV